MYIGTVICAILFAHSSELHYSLILIHYILKGKYVDFNIDVFKGVFCLCDKKNLTFVSLQIEFIKLAE